MRAPLAVVVIGVSGSGKSTIGALLAKRLGCEFADADAFHSPSNVAKMASGEALTDADRAPWLASIGEWINAKTSVGQSCVVACSALRRQYRAALASYGEHVIFVELVVDEAELDRRMHQRSEHFMPVTLLASQLSTYEALGPTEDGFSVLASGDPSLVTDGLFKTLSGYSWLK